MTMNYNWDIFNKYHELAVTKQEDLVIGQTYYTNTYPEQITIQKIYENDISIRADGIDEAGKETHVYLHDFNVGASYNPWMLFADKQIAKQCEEELRVPFVHDPLDDIFDRDYFDYDDDYFDYDDDYI